MANLVVASGLCQSPRCWTQPARSHRRLWSDLAGGQTRVCLQPVPLHRKPDHLLAMDSARIRQPPVNFQSLHDHDESILGPLASPIGVEANAFLSTDSMLSHNSSSSTWPDVQINFVSSHPGYDGGTTYKEFLGVSDEVLKAVRIRTSLALKLNELFLPGV